MLKLPMMHDDCWMQAQKVCEPHEEVLMPGQVVLWSPTSSLLQRNWWLLEQRLAVHLWIKGGSVERVETTNFAISLWGIIKDCVKARKKNEACHCPASFIQHCRGKQKLLSIWPDVHVTTISQVCILFFKEQMVECNGPFIFENKFIITNHDKAVRLSSHFLSSLLPPDISLSLSSSLSEVSHYINISDDFFFQNKEDTP